jgi:hypothetical protein
VASGKAPPTGNPSGKTASVAENDNKTANKSGSQSKGGESQPPTNREARGQ